MKTHPSSPGQELARQWFASRGWTPMDFQVETWQALASGYSGIVNAPTGSGKTYSILMGFLALSVDQNLDIFSAQAKGIKLIWITPIRALSKEILGSAQRAIDGMGLPWRAEIRTGDTSATDRKNQWKNPPQIMITTPESLHVLMCQKEYQNLFATVECVVVDEWHELVGSKRGVQTELFVSRIRHMRPEVSIWGISATIGNMAEAIDILLYGIPELRRRLIKCDIRKKITVQSILPDEIETFTWAGHLGIKLVDKVVDIIHQSRTTLIFTNTRAQSEIWYQKLIDHDEELMGRIAMHHGSISKDIREWVEDALYEGNIKAVVCTSSLDLGVDFRPVETIIQVGSPKGVARFVQRAGRSGHEPFAESKIWFCPTHALELMEASGLREAIHRDILEERTPYIRSFDVLVQYMMTLAVSTGFDEGALYQEVIHTFAYQSVSREEWQSLLHYLVYGSSALQAYDEFKKVVRLGSFYYVEDKKIALRHKLSIGTIVSDGLIQIKLVKGTYLGSIEEWFVSQLTPGDVFWFAGRALEFVRLKEMAAQVRLSSAKTGKIPSYQGGRMPLSSPLSAMLKERIYRYVDGYIDDIEMATIEPILHLQMQRSKLPHRGSFLVEYFEDKEGCHLLMYPFEGRNVHEGLAALVAKRISMLMPITFTIAMNDFGFELLSDTSIDVDKIVTKDLFASKDLTSDIQSTINAVEMARRKFRDIARISGLIFGGFPGKQKKERHLQSSSQLIFDVYRQYETDNLLFLQAYEEVMIFQLEEVRIRQTLQSILDSEWIVARPEKASPLSFPIIVDRLRERMSSEQLIDRIQKMAAYNKNF